MAKTKLTKKTSVTKPAPLKKCDSNISKAASTKAVKQVIEQKLAEDKQGDAKTTQVDAHVPGGSNYAVYTEGPEVFSVYLM
jgi:hypothetical protein